MKMKPSSNPLPNRKAIAARRGTRVMSKAREAEARHFVGLISDACRKYGFRIEPMESFGNLAVFDERDVRPASFPVAAFAKCIGVQVKGLHIEAIMPKEL